MGNYFNELHWKNIRPFCILFIQTKINEQTKQNKTVVKVYESL